MIANALLITVAFLLAYGFWLMGELKFMAAYKAVLFHAYGPWICGSAGILFFYLFCALFLFARKVFFEEPRPQPLPPRQTVPGWSDRDAGSLPRSGAFLTCPAIPFRANQRLT